MNTLFYEKKQKIISKLVDCGVQLNQAKIVADVMVTADVYGVTTHGANVLPSYIEKIRHGGINLQPVITVVKEGVSFAVVDADNSFGFVSADWCMDLAVEKAKNCGIFHVFSFNNNTVGPAFYYPLKAAKQGMIGILFSNSPAQMAPVGGKQKMLGTNPFAAVIPIPGQDPIIIDMATSAVAKSKFREYKLAGKELPDGWALNKDGNPTNNPDEGIQGLVVPMAGFKGYGLAMLIDICAGVLSGAAFLDDVGRFYTEDNTAMNIGFCCAAFNPQLILGDNYEPTIQNYVKKLRQSEKIGENEIVLPGDDRIRCMKNNEKEQGRELTIEDCTN